MIAICPHCKSSQVGAPIPTKHFIHLSDCPLPEGTKSFPGRCFCLPYGDKPEDERFFMRTVLVEVEGLYDGGLFYQCPDCGGRWHRWPEGSYLHAAAELFVKRKTVEDEVMKCSCPGWSFDQSINYDLPVCKCGHVDDEHDENGCNMEQVSTDTVEGERSSG